MAKNGLTVQQSKFVAAYQGNATEAAIAAGYSAKTAHVQGCRLLSNAKVAESIEKRAARDAKPTIASREERQELLTKIMREDGEKASDRIKATEILGKMNGDFLERVEHSGGFTLAWEEAKS